MPTTKDFVEYILDQIGDQNARARAMFGEYGLYYDNAVVGLICDNTLFVKITPATQKILGANAKTGPAYPGAKPAFVISAELIEDGESLRELLLACAGDVQKIKNTSGKITSKKKGKK